MSEVAAELESLEPQPVRCFAASCATHFAPAWSRWPARNDIELLTDAENLLWSAVSEPDVAALKDAETRLRQIPIFLDHYSDSLAVLITQKGLLIMGYALLLAQDANSKPLRGQLHFACRGLCGELDAFVTPGDFGGRKTRAVRTPEIRALKQGELERQSALIADLRSARNLKTYALRLRERLADSPQRLAFVQALNQIPAA